MIDPKLLLNELREELLAYLKQPEIQSLKELAKKGDDEALLCLLVDDFKKSCYRVDAFSAVEGLDATQESIFAYLQELGEDGIPLAYLILGELSSGHLGHIRLDFEVGKPYFKHYAELTGDSSIIDDYDAYARKVWAKRKNVISVLSKERALGHRPEVVEGRTLDYYRALRGNK